MVFLKMSVNYHILEESFEQKQVFNYFSSAFDAESVHKKASASKFNKPVSSIKDIEV